MGHRVLNLTLPTDIGDVDLTAEIGRRLKIRDFSWEITRKSLDARQRKSIRWEVRVTVVSDELDGPPPPPAPALQIPHRKNRGRAVVVGSGPAGFFAALTLQLGGYAVTLLERGADVQTRAARLAAFEAGGAFDRLGTYTCGEGGAGTFSDGKLTSRTKTIALERDFILSWYIRAGAPEEIRYLAHPHIGSDNLRRVVARLREAFEALGGRMLFQTTVEDLRVQDGRVRAAVTSAGDLEADLFFIAPGHSAYDTYRMLMRRGVLFRVKGFAIGTRMEHPQTLINRAQWGVERLPGVKAAEYRLASAGGGVLPVYSFCMCPGGTVVPAAATAGANVVNGMSDYARDGRFANAGCVAGVHPDQLLGGAASPEAALACVEEMEARFHRVAGGHRAPACRIRDFLSGAPTPTVGETSHPLGVLPAPLWEMLPPVIVEALRAGLRDFARRMSGFEEGMLLGLESKTSAPIQVQRDAGGRSAGFENLYVIGEGSGFAGGIISSAADGVKAAVAALG